MKDPYMAVALQTSLWEDKEKNLEHITEGVDTTVGLASLEYPVKLVTLPEAAVQGLEPDPDKATTIPGEETDRLGELAEQFGIYICGELFNVIEDGFEDRFFNKGFVIDPNGDVIHERAKLQLEHGAECISTSPHDVWDDWMEDEESALDALYPVVDTDIGKIGCMICADGGYPEISRGLAMNGAEIIYRPTYHEPFVSDGTWKLQNRAHAMFNTCYVVAPNAAGYTETAESPAPFDIGGGKSMIVGYKGNVLNEVESGNNTYAAGEINIDALRDRRTSVMGLGNFPKDLRTEAYQPIYEDPVYQKNARLEEERPEDAWLQSQTEQYQTSIATLIERGVYEEPTE